MARLYRLALEKATPAACYHAVAEEGVSSLQIFQTLGQTHGLPVVSLEGPEAERYFGWLTPFMAMDMLASSDWTRAELDWEPTGPSLLDDLKSMQPV